MFVPRSVMIYIAKQLLIGNNRILSIANINGAVKRIDELSCMKYVVKLQNGNGDYEVNSTDLGWVCTYPDVPRAFQNVNCKGYSVIQTKTPPSQGQLCRQICWVRVSQMH
jgi:hypothetical protein